MLTCLVLRIGKVVTAGAISRSFFGEDRVAALGSRSFLGRNRVDLPEAPCRDDGKKAPLVAGAYEGRGCRQEKPRAGHIPLQRDEPEVG
jgi:hypothetical protein